MAWIKSHSNYVLKKKHQEVSDGTVWERDITTIGGINQFAKGQVPIYQSGNFIITVRADKKTSNQYNSTSWVDNDNGSVWTLEEANNAKSNFDDDNDLKIVLKQDYYDFRDFAYYGSLSELFRASITDILNRFPGELYITENVYIKYKKDKTEYYLGSDALIEEPNSETPVLVSNPFGIDIHKQGDTLSKTSDNPLRYFMAGGYKNFVIISDDTQHEIVDWIVDFEKKPEEEDNAFEKENKSKKKKKEIDFICEPGSKFCTITLSINDNKNDDITIWGYIGDGMQPYYLSKSKDIHIRPKEEFVAKFYNECDNFQKLLVDRTTTPLYSPIFSVIEDSPRGYVRKMRTFTFPTSYGGYNLDADTYGFNDYTMELSTIGEFYDEHFTDNLWRSMTHEAIKNFDWSYTREFNQGDDEEYIHGGQKFQKALRIFAREFDEAKAYIDNMRFMNRITYDERSNMPDYFLTDSAKEKGWDVMLIYPYDLKETFDDGSEVNDYSTTTQLNNGTVSGDTFHHFKREFSQNGTKTVKPYYKDREYGYYMYMLCCDKDNNVIEDTDDCADYGGKWQKQNAGEDSSFTMVDDCGNIRNRIKPYIDEREYTYNEANNSFLRNLIINSPYIWRSKGTLESIEMVLGLFGLRSERWCDRYNSQYSQCPPKYSPNYKLEEYSSLTERIEEKWDAAHQKYRIDWINATKNIVYDYRSMSNYTINGASTTGYVPYQGLPVVYRDADLRDGKEMYLAVGPLKPDENQTPTSNKNGAFTRMGNGRLEYVKRRFLYPNFEPSEQLDGDPYFQMNGGWLSKSIQIDNNTTYNFQFDVDDNIAYCSGGTRLYKETVRNIKRFDNITELITQPYNELSPDIICYVTKIKDNLAIVNSQAYDIHYEYSGDGENPLRYITLTKTNGRIIVGNDGFFDGNICVYIALLNEKEEKEDEPSGVMALALDEEEKEDEDVKIMGDYILTTTTYSVADMDDGDEIKAYIYVGKDGEGNDEVDFICRSSLAENSYTIDSFVLMDSLYESGYTNYFILEDTYYHNRIATDSDAPTGWRRLKESDPEYLKVNTIENYFEGNNPHNGNMVYDNGHEYFTYFKRLFKYAADNEKFDQRCYENFYLTLESEINECGFKNLIYQEERNIFYDNLLVVGDEKIHYFGNYYAKGEDVNDYSWSGYCNQINWYGLIEEKDNDNDNKSKKDAIIAMTPMSGVTVNQYRFYDPNCCNDEEDNDNCCEECESKMLRNGKIYQCHIDNNGGYDKSKIDEITNLIMNNKRFKISFFMTNEPGSKEWLEELKYYDKVVMNYLTQVVPSTVIMEASYCRYVNE